MPGHVLLGERETDASPFGQGGPMRFQQTRHPRSGSTTFPPTVSRAVNSPTHQPDGIRERPALSLPTHGKNHAGCAPNELRRIGGCDIRRLRCMDRVSRASSTRRDSGRTRVDARSNGECSRRTPAPIRMKQPDLGPPGGFRPAPGYPGDSRAPLRDGAERWHPIGGSPQPIWACLDGGHASCSVDSGPARSTPRSRATRMAFS